MLSRLSAAVVGLLAFAGCIVVGMVSKNPAATILTRALVGLFGGMLVGYVTGALAQVVINEHFRNMVKADIDAEMAAEAEAETDVDGAAVEETSPDAAPDGFADKVDTEDSREQVNAPVEDGTLAARAAKELLPEV